MQFTTSQLSVLSLSLAALSAGCFADEAAAPACDASAIWVGDADISSTDQLEELLSFTTVQGNVTVRLANSDVAPAGACLRSIEGNLIIENSDLDNAAAFEQLEHVWGEIVVRDNRSVTRIHQPRLSLAGALLVENNDSLAELTFAGDVHALAQVKVAGNARLKTVVSLSLEQVGGDLEISGNDDLTSLWLPNLSEVHGDLIIRDNPRLSNCSARALADQLVARGFAGNVVITGNGAAADADDGVEGSHACR